MLDARVAQGASTGFILPLTEAAHRRFWTNRVAPGVARGIARALRQALEAAARTQGRDLLTLDTRSDAHAEPL